MSPSQLDEASQRRLATQEVTYAETGSTAGELPAGYHHLCQERLLGTGRGVFEDAAQRLLTWQMHEASGMTVRSSSPVVQLDGLVILGVRLGPLRLNAPCRVIYVIDDPARRGFAYGTLPGHPESGEESFVVEIAEDGHVMATIRAFSRPASKLTRLGGPVTRRIQNRATQSYLDGLSP